FSNTLGGDEAMTPDTLATAEATAITTPSGVSDVSPSYFDVIDLPFLRGATFGPRNDSSDAIVSESLARTLFTDRDPIGQRLSLATASSRQLRIVGVVRDVPSVRGKPAQRTLYRRRAPDAIGDALVVRFDGDERQTATAIRDTILTLDPN